MDGPPQEFIPFMVGALNFQTDEPKDSAEVAAMRVVEMQRNLILSLLLIEAVCANSCRKSEDSCDASASACENSSDGRPTPLSQDLPPVPGAGPTFSDITESAYTVSWAAASDKFTKTTDLEYRLVSAFTTEELNTVTKAMNIGGTNVLVDWSSSTFSKAVSGISPAQHSAYAVLVRDEIGNVGLYAPQTIASETIDAGVPGAISISDVTESSFTVNWSAASSPFTAQEDLEYRAVVAGSTEEIDTVAEALALPSSAVILDWTKNQLSVARSGLPGNTNFAFTVLVRSASGLITQYKPIIGRTGSYRLIFITSRAYSGSQVQSAANADALCNLEPRTGRGTFKALLASTSRMACQTTNCGGSGASENLDWVMEANRTYENESGQVLWTTTDAGIVTVSSHNPIAPTQSRYAWTGLESGWVSSSLTCADWTSAAPSDVGALGLANSSTQSGWASSAQPCNVPAYLYCVEQ